MLGKNLLERRRRLEAATVTVLKDKTSSVSAKILAKAGGEVQVSVSGPLECGLPVALEADDCTILGEVRRVEPDEGGNNLAWIGVEHSIAAKGLAHPPFQARTVVRSVAQPLDQTSNWIPTDQNRRNLSLALLDQVARVMRGPTEQPKAGPGCLDQGTKWLLHDRWMAVLGEIPSKLGQLALVSSLRDAAGIYSHYGLAFLIGSEETALIIRKSHYGVFRDWLALKTSQQWSDIEMYFTSLGRLRRELVEEWVGTRPYLRYIPPDAKHHEAALYCADMEAVLCTMAAEYQHESVTSNVKFHGRTVES